MQKTTSRAGSAGQPMSASEGGTPTLLDQVLDLARWAPSGDNSQPWRFETVADDHVRVHAFDTRRHCVYDLEGHASQLSVGALLETLRIAASLHGRAVRVVRQTQAPEEAPVFDVWLTPDPSLRPDALADAILTRSVQRKPLSTRPLTAAEKAGLEVAAGPQHTLVWFEGPRKRWDLAWLAVRSAKIRLTIPEAYAVHRDIIEWDARYSEDRVPDQALGADRLSVRSMRWAMASWERVHFMNRWFAGTMAPRLQLDLLPGVRCAAHFALLARRAPTSMEDRLEAGAAVQRFWLRATTLGLQLQPQYTPLVFADYARRGVPFTAVSGARQRAARVASMLQSLLGPTAPQAVFLGRVGHGAAATARSLRLPLEQLRWVPPAQGDTAKKAG